MRFNFCFLSATCIVFVLAGCGGGSDVQAPPVVDPTPPPVVDPTPPPALKITLSSSSKNSAVGSSYTLSWTLSREAQCELSGVVTQTVSSTGQTIVTARTEGVEEAILSCEGQSVKSQTRVIPEFIDIPDPVFASAMDRAGWPVVSGQMRGETALKVDMICITSLQGYYGEADENGTAIFDNPSVPDYGVRCAYTPPGEYIADMTGLEHLLNLRTIRLEHQKTTTVNLNGLNNIQLLGLWGIPIQSIDLSGNSEVVYLGLSETSLTTVDTSHMPLLEEAALHQNDRDVPYTTSHGTEVLGFNKLDFSKNTKLKRVYLNSNPLKDFGISQNSNSLQELWATNTDIETLDIAGFSSLNYVILNRSASLRALNLIGVNHGKVPYRLYLQYVPLLGEVIVNDAASYEQVRNTPGVWVDSHVVFVEGK